MRREITKRELSNNSGDDIRALDQGKSFVVTRNGVAVGELTPLRTRTFVSAEAALAAFAGAPAISADRFRSDIDAVLDTIRHRADEVRSVRGLVDISVVIGLERSALRTSPAELAVSAITMAELAAGPHATADPQERARRKTDSSARATFDALPVDGAVARAYGPWSS